MSGKKRKPERINIDHILNDPGGDTGEEEVIEIVDDSDAAPADVSEAPAGEAGSGAGSALEEALREKQEMQDRCMRALADLDNFRKRVDRERAEQRLRLSMDLVREILPAVDNLGLAVSQPADAPGFQDGIALIHRQFEEALKKLGVEPIETLGEAFDPVYHEALSVEPREGFEPNTIIEEIRKGYTLEGRVVRPSLVRVVTAPSPERGGDEGGSGEADGTGHRN